MPAERLGPLGRRVALPDSWARRTAVGDCRPAGRRGRGCRAGRPRECPGQSRCPPGSAAGRSASVALTRGCWRENAATAGAMWRRPAKRGIHPQQPADGLVAGADVGFQRFPARPAAPGRAGRTASPSWVKCMRRVVRCNRRMPSRASSAASRRLITGRVTPCSRASASAAGAQQRGKKRQV